MDNYNYRDLTDNIILNPGDLIVDELTGFVGILIRKERRIDMFDDDIYFWEVKWVKNVNRDYDPTEVPNSNIHEEEGLKLSIIVEMIRLYPAEEKGKDF